MDLMTVYAVQQQMRFDQETRELVPRFPNMEKANKWGKLVFLLSQSDHPFDTDIILGGLHQKLKDYNDNDHLLLIGNPALIGMATAVASYYNDGSVNFLQWSSKHLDYTEIIAKIY